MHTRVFSSASALLLMAAVGVSPAVAYPPVEQRSPSSENSSVFDSTDYGPASHVQGSPPQALGSSIYGGSSNTYGSSSRSPQKAVSTNSQWELVNQLQLLQEEVQQLRGMIEQQKFEIEQIRKQQRDRYLDLDSRINRLSGTQGSSSVSSASSSPVPASSPDPLITPSTAPVQVASGDEKAAYSAALDNVKAKQYPKAIAQLEALLVSSPNGQLAPNCHYWLGELYMVNNPAEYDKAKAHFQQLLKNHVDHAKVPDALYKLGKLSALRGERDRAKIYFDRVIQDFPEAQAAILAKDYLKRL